MIDLIICSNMIQLENLKNRCSPQYLAATSKYSFYAVCKKAGVPVIYLEPEERSDFDAVVSIIDRIMGVIDDCDVQNRYLYRVSYHVEGGFPSIIDMLLQNIRLLKRVTRKYNINKMYLCDDKENWQVNEAAFILAQSAHLQCQIADEYGRTEREVLFTLRRSSYNRNVRKSEFDPREHAKDRIQYLQQKSSIREYDRIEEKEIGFLYAAVNNGKHFQWTLDELQMFADRFQVEVISFYRSEDNERFRGSHVSVVCLEDYFDRALFAENYEIYLRDSRCIADKLNESLEYVYDGIDLSAYLKRKVINYIERVCFQKLYIDTCSSVFFKTHKYKIIRAWGDTNFWQSNVIYANTRQHDTKLLRKETLEIFRTKIYEPYSNEILLRMWCDKEAYNYWTLKNFSGRIYYLFDYNWTNFVKGISASKLFLTEQVHILFAPSSPLIGYSTVKSFFETCMTVLGRLPSEQCIVTFKNHPNIEKEIQSEIETRYISSEYIQYIDKMSGIWSEIQSCDIVITTASTVMFDAVKAGKPVFCIASCQDYELIRHHEGAIKIYRDVNECCDYILELLGNRQKMELELQKLVHKQNEYLKALVGEIPENGYGGLYDILNKEIGV